MRRIPCLAIVSVLLVSACREVALPAPATGTPYMSALAMAPKPAPNSVNQAELPKVDERCLARPDLAIESVWVAPYSVVIRQADGTSTEMQPGGMVQLCVRVRNLGGRTWADPTRYSVPIKAWLNGGDAIAGDVVGIRDHATGVAYDACVVAAAPTVSRVAQDGAALPGEIRTPQGNRVFARVVFDPDLPTDADPSNDDCNGDNDRGSDRWGYFLRA